MDFPDEEFDDTDEKVVTTGTYDQRGPGAG